jgi:hypothetical protein
MAIIPGSYGFIGGVVLGNDGGKQFVLTRSDMTTAFTDEEYNQCINALMNGLAVAVSFGINGVVRQAQLVSKTNLGALTFSCTRKETVESWTVAATSPHTVTHDDYDVDNDITPLVNTGTKIAEGTVNGQQFELFAPSYSDAQFVLRRTDMVATFTDNEYQDCVNAVIAGKAVCVQYGSSQVQLAAVAGGALYFNGCSLAENFQYVISPTGGNHTITRTSAPIGSGYTPKGLASVAILNTLSGQENGWLYTMTDAGTLTDGSLAVVAGDTVAWDATNEVWYKAMDYAPRQYGTNEVKNLQTSITTFRSGDVIPVDGPSGTAKMAKDDLLKETAENALVGNVAEAFDDTKNYVTNQVVLHDNKLYYFRVAHNAGAWTGNDVIETNVDELIQNSKLSNIYTTSEVTLDSKVVGYALNGNQTYHNMVYQDYGSAYDTFVFPVEKGKSYTAKNVYGNANQPLNIIVSVNAISVGDSQKKYTWGRNNGLSVLGKADVEFVAPVSGYCYVTGKTGDDDVELIAKNYKTCAEVIDTLVPSVNALSDDVDALKDYTNIEEYIYTYDEISSSDSAVGYALNANSQYHMAQYEAYGSAFDTFVFPVVAGKTYKATNVYGNNNQPTNIVVSKNAISVGGSAKGYTDGWNTGLSSLGKVDKEFTAAVNGYAYITGKTGDNDVKLYEVIATPKTIKQKFDEIEYGRTNQWSGKKVVWMGTSVPFGSNASTSYAKVASDVLGFEIVPACVPGLAIECMYDSDSGLLYPKQYGSSALTKAEYTAAKAAGLTNITINDSPVTPWSPGGGYNNYYCTWENVINNDNADADLWVLDVVPNNGGWSTSDWDAFDFANWEYSDQSSFADHRRTFLGALLYLINEIYTLNPNARICLMLGSYFSYDQGKTAFAKLQEKGVALIDIWKKANWLKPSLQAIKSLGGTDWHPSNFGHECLGKMLANELLLIA